MQVSKETIRKFADGDLTAFPVIFRAAVDDVYWLAYRMLGSREAAEDVVQETFIRIYKMRKQLDPEKPFRSFVLRIATNLAIDLLRKTRRENWVPYPDESECGTEQLYTVPAYEEGTYARQVALNQALDALPAIYRAVLVLKYGHDLSYQEIAQALDISVPAVALRLKRGKELLRQKLNSTAT
ncbi:MAG: RNA polymerase sigma factor [Acidobacteria bacterium]|nr:RNA polymerase sigma factor [Acidobacteriota bacterium]